MGFVSRLKADLYVQLLKISGNPHVAAVYGEVVKMEGGVVVVLHQVSI